MPTKYKPYGLIEDKILNSRVHMDTGLCVTLFSRRAIIGGIMTQNWYMTVLDTRLTGISALDVFHTEKEAEDAFELVTK